LGLPRGPRSSGKSVAPCVAASRDLIARAGLLTVLVVGSQKSLEKIQNYNAGESSELFFVSGERPYTCPVSLCGKLFARRSALRIHKAAVHGSVKVVRDLGEKQVLFLVFAQN
jgi:hypothetical protein